MDEKAIISMDYQPTRSPLQKYVKGNRREPNEEADNSTVLLIMDLSDDCLEPIFLKLSKGDLANMAESNKRFLEKACYAFARKHAQQPFQSGYDPMDSNSYQQSLNIIKYFGRLIQKLDLYDAHNDCPYNEQITDAIFATCDANITDMIFDRVDQDTLNKISRPFPNLTNLNFYDLSLPQKIAQLNRWFPNVNRLTLRCSGSFDEEFCSLHNLTVADIAMNINDMTLFIRSNPQLTSLSFRVDNSQLVDGQFLNAIADHLPALVQLSIRINNWQASVYQANAHFQHLRTISLTLYGVKRQHNANQTHLGITSSVLQSTKIEGLLFCEACVGFALLCPNATDLDIIVSNEPDTILFLQLADHCQKLNRLQMIFREEFNADGFVLLAVRCANLRSITFVFQLEFINSYERFCQTYSNAKRYRWIHPNWKLKALQTTSDEAVFVEIYK